MFGKKKYDICVIGGLGHVGLPLSILFAEVGKKVVVYDLNKTTQDVVSQGKMPFKEDGAEEILNKVINKNLFISCSKDDIRNSDFIIVVIGTPAGRHLNPEFTVLKDLFAEIMDYLSDDQHIILRSTLYPGTTEKIKEYLASKGKRPRISFCPERISQGAAVKELKALPQIVAAFDETSKNEAKELFSLLTKDVTFLTPLEAELGKLFCNIWRYIEFSIANQFFQIALENNADFYKIYDAITYKYPRTVNFKKAGFAAGPCLFKDTVHMVSYTGNSFHLGSAAILVNEGLPNFIVRRLKDRHDIKSKRAGILGMAFKADIDDPRDSLSFKLRNMLEIEAKEVLCSDSYIKRDDFVSAEDLIKNSDIIILGVPHKQYANLVIPKEKVLVDIWNFFGGGGLF